MPRMVPRRLWVPVTVMKARAAVKDPKTITAVITGRPNEHCLRVKKILHQMEIRPDFIMCRTFEWEATLEDVLSFKVEAINEILGGWRWGLKCFIFVFPDETRTTPITTRVVWR